MDRNIIVKGTGTVRIPPDQIVLPLQLTARDEDYETALSQGRRQLAEVRRAVADAGFAPEELKTGSFDVSPEFESVQDEAGRYRQVFAGYRCAHALKLTFDLDTARLAAVVASLAKCGAVPEFHVQFTVKDQGAVSAKLLEKAAADALAKAETLCAASGVRLGQLQRIEYNWGESGFFSETRMNVAAKRMEAGADLFADVAPQDIETQDTATFVWSIE